MPNRKAGQISRLKSYTPRSREQRSQNSGKKVRYAVVGLGYIAQIAVLPAFKHARNSELRALVSSDPKKLKELGRKYGVSNTYSYEDYAACLESGEVDAVYIALPNVMHREYAERAARAGIHVLCEKPMAITEHECESMIEAAQRNRVKLMIAYRLHFEEANLRAVDIVNSEKLGQPRIFNSVFSQQVKEGDIRLKKKLGGGTLYDMGIYCINAARYLFREEPVEVTAFTGRREDKRFQEVDEACSAVMRFPQDKKFPKRDQFAPELIYFSNCALNDKDPGPSGLEGLADVRIIRALYRSAESGTPVKLDSFPLRKRPAPAQEITSPPIQKPKLVNAQSPSGS